MTPLLSVIVPVYNTKKYLRECIDSILAQTYNDYELILVDDGSSDGSSEICDEYAEAFSNVTVIHKANGGTVSSRNAGIQRAQGEYVTFVDSDDWIESSMYEQMMKKTQETNADIVMCDILFEDAGVKVHPNHIEEGFFDKNALCELIYPRMLFNYDSCCPSVNPSMCNKIFCINIIRDVTKDVNAAVSYGEDALCTFPALLKAKNVFVTHEHFYHYRHNGESVSNRYDGSILDKMILLETELRRQFKKCGFEGESQIHGYIARLSVEFIRNELLLHTGVALRERITIVKEYMKIESVKKSFNSAVLKVNDSKVKMKMKLILKGKYLELYLLFYLKNLVLKIKRSKYEN